jgi:hypothetical protein
VRSGIDVGGSRRSEAGCGGIDADSLPTLVTGRQLSDVVGHGSAGALLSKVSTLRQRRSRARTLLGVARASGATLLAAIAGTTALVESTGRTVAGILALISSGLGAVLTAVNASQRTTQAAASANAYLEIQTAARRHREIDLNHWTMHEARGLGSAAGSPRRAEHQGGGPQPPLVPKGEGEPAGGDAETRGGCRDLTMVPAGRALLPV